MGLDPSRDVGRVRIVEGHVAVIEDRESSSGDMPSQPIGRIDRLQRRGLADRALGPSRVPGRFVTAWSKGMPVTAISTPARSLP
jgi:hypothetical protein